MENIDTTSHSTSSGASLSVIAQKDMNINGQVTVTEPQKYTKEGQTNFECVSHSMQNIDTTSYSTSSEEILSAIAQTDMNVNGQVTVTEPQKYTEEGSNQMIRFTDSVQRIDTTSHFCSINKARLSNSANYIKDHTYCIKETETFHQASYKAMANDDIRSNIILGSELSQTDNQYFLSKYDDFNNDSDNRSVGKFNSKLLWGDHLERVNKIVQQYNDLYTTFNRTHNHIANAQLIYLTGDIPDSYKNNAKDNSIYSVQNTSAVDKIHPSLKSKSNTILEMINMFQ